MLKPSQHVEFRGDGFFALQCLFGLGPKLFAGSELREPRVSSEPREILRVPQQNLGQELATHKQADQNLNRPRVTGEKLQKIQ